MVHVLEVWHVGEVEASQTQADRDAAEHEQVVSPRVLLPVCQTVPVRYPVLKHFKITIKFVLIHTVEPVLCGLYHDRPLVLKDRFHRHK